MTAGLNPSFSKIRRPELPRSVPVDKGGHVKGSDVIEGELSNLARDALTDPPACRVRLTLHTGSGSGPGTSATRLGPPLTRHAARQHYRTEYGDLNATVDSMMWAGAASVVVW